MNTHTTLTTLNTAWMTFPGRKDSMTQYVADNAPALAPLAPFDFFHSEPFTGVVLERVAADIRPSLTLVRGERPEVQWTPSVADAFSDFN